MKNKKGQLGELQTLIIALVAAGVVLVVGALILAELNAQTVAQESINGYAQNSTLEVQAALGEIPSWLSIIVITVIGALLLGLVQLFRSR